MPPIVWAALRCTSCWRCRTATYPVLGGTTIQALCYLNSYLHSNLMSLMKRTLPSFLLVLLCAALLPSADASQITLTLDTENTQSPSTRRRITGSYANGIPTPCTFTVSGIGSCGPGSFPNSAMRSSMELQGSSNGITGSAVAYADSSEGRMGILSSIDTTEGMTKGAMYAVANVGFNFTVLNPDDSWAAIWFGMAGTGTSYWNQDSAMMSNVGHSVVASVVSIANLPGGNYSQGNFSRRVDVSSYASANAQGLSGQAAVCVLLPTQECAAPGSGRLAPAWWDDGVAYSLGFSPVAASEQYGAQSPPFGRMDWDVWFVLAMLPHSTNYVSIGSSFATSIAVEEKSSKALGISVTHDFIHTAGHSVVLPRGVTLSSGGAPFISFDSQVPEPSTVSLLVLSGALLGALGWKRRQRL
jgi:hypothetical protein